MFLLLFCFWSKIILLLLFLPFLSFPQDAPSASSSKWQWNRPARIVLYPWAQLCWCSSCDEFSDGKNTNLVIPKYSSEVSKAFLPSFFLVLGMSQGIITPVILSSSSSSSKLLVLRRRRLCAKNAHGWCGGERSPTNLGKKSQSVGCNTGKSLLCMETHVPVYVEGSRCKESRVHVDYMGRRFSRMIMGEEEGNPVVGYAQGRRRSSSSSSRRRIWDRNRNRCWRGRSTMTLIGPECGHLLFCTLSACAAFAQVKEKEKFFSL